MRTNTTQSENSEESFDIWKTVVVKRLLSLEKKLIKEDFYDAFTDCVEDFIEKGVLIYPEQRMDKLHQSFIPLTYTLRRGGTTPLRVCGISSFRSGDNLTLNECALRGPNFLQNLGHILVRCAVLSKDCHRRHQSLLPPNHDL